MYMVGDILAKAGVRKVKNDGMKKRRMIPM